MAQVSTYFCWSLKVRRVTKAICDNDACRRRRAAAVTRRPGKPSCFVRPLVPDRTRGINNHRLRRQKKGFIMIGSLILFVHITGVLTMFAGLALEAFGVEPTGRATPRIFGLAVPLTLLSGLYLGARFGILGDAWMLASYGAIVVMAAAGPLARRSDALRQLSLRVRAAFGLAIVFLMIAKPDAMVSLVVLGLALGVSILVGLPIGFKQPSGLSSTEA